MGTQGNPVADKDFFGDLEKGSYVQDSPDSDMEPEDKNETSRIPSLADVLESRDPSNAVTEPRQEVNLTDWNGPDDPENPFNWPMWLRVYHSTVPALFGFAV